MNVLVYNGSGVAAASRDHAVASLRAFLSHRYDVQLVTPKALRSDPWQDNCALLVFPGGRDIPYMFDLEGPGNERIRNWVERGGRYLGFCAGAYYASERVEFETGTDLEVIGDRQLRFFPGVCRGTVFPGFAYDSEAGAREVSVELERTHFRDHWQQSPETVDVWYNGGGAFELDSSRDLSNVDVLGRYGGLQDKPVAGVKTRVGKGVAVLWAVHPEHPAFYDVLAPQSNSTEIYHDKERRRRGVLRATLSMMKLDVSDEPAPDPKLLPLFLSSWDSAAVGRVAESLARASERSDGIVQLPDRHDTFALHAEQSAVSLLDRARAQPGTSDPDQLKAAKKEICICTSQPPPKQLTPLFDHSKFFAELRINGQSARTQLGNVLMYGEVVTSTQTMLDK